MILGSFKKRQLRYTLEQKKRPLTDGRKQCSQKTRVSDDNMLFLAPNHGHRDGGDYHRAKKAERKYRWDLR